MWVEYKKLYKLTHFILTALAFSIFAFELIS